MIVLDTHVWIWWVENNSRLGPEARKQIGADSDIRVSAVSLWEIAILTANKRLILHPSPDRWLEIAQLDALLRTEPFSTARRFSQRSYARRPPLTMLRIRVSASHCNSAARVAPGISASSAWAWAL